MEIRKKLGEILLGHEKISIRDLERALLAQGEMGGLLGRVLVRLGVVAEIDVVRALAEQGGYLVKMSEDLPTEPVDVKGIAIPFLISQVIVPLPSAVSGVFPVVMARPQDVFAVRAIELSTGLTVEPYIGLESELRAVLSKFYEEPDAAVEEEETLENEGLNDSEFIEHLKDLATEAPVIQFVNKMVHYALDERASDIHVEPFDDGLHIRYRVDGVLHQSEQAPASLSAAIVSRIKLLARLNIAERRLPQDGRIMTRVKGHELDLRVSTVPTVHGESVVMRVLDRQSIRLSLEDMGFSSDTLSEYNKLLSRPHGILLLTGPTGSGKTTTLYASLAKLDTHALKVLTVEDPVEYQLEGVNQVQVQSQIGLTFSNVLRSILRQDPDVIMIGEMRDGETAQIAVQSALTGHLVLSTLHTNTAAGAIIRLDDMGVERYLITSSVNGVIGQRLVRTLCKKCCVSYLPSALEREEMGLDRFLPVGQEIHRAVGCSECGGTGYKGRVAIHELFVMSDQMRLAILSGADATALHALARKEGMFTLYEDGLRKVVAGLTSVEEVMRVAQDQGHD